MSKEYKFCSCKACRNGRHRAGSKTKTEQKARQLRRKTKEALKQGKEPPTQISIPYTD